MTAKLLIPLIALFAFYVQFHGDLGAGGGFQAGVILAVAVDPACAGVRPARDDGGDPGARSCASVAALGVLLYAGVGIVCIVNGGGFLDYDYLFPPSVEAMIPPGLLGDPDHAHHWGQHFGIFFIELGVLLTVSRDDGDDLLRLRRARGRTRREASAMSFVVTHFNYIAVIVLMMIGLFIVFSQRQPDQAHDRARLFQTSTGLFYISLGKVTGGTAAITLDAASAEGRALAAQLDPAYVQQFGVDGVVYSNPLPHVLILTAIVVGVATLAVGLAIAVRIREAYGTVEADEIEAVARVRRCGADGARARDRCSKPSMSRRRR